MKLFDLFKKKKDPAYSIELVRENKEPNIEEVRCYKDGIYTHSVKVFVFPEEVIEELQRIQENINGRKSL